MLCCAAFYAFLGNYPLQCVITTNIYYHNTHTLGDTTEVVTIASNSYIIIAISSYTYTWLGTIVICDVKGIASYLYQSDIIFYYSYVYAGLTNESWKP